MKRGKLPRWISVTLSAGPFEPDYAPDGLTEADVDALIVELRIDLGPEPPAEPDDQAEAKVIPLRLNPPESDSEQHGDEVA